MAALSDIEREQKLAVYSGPDKVVSIKDVVAKYKDRPEELSRKCGIPTLDNTIGGFFPGQLVVISGTSGHGKTTLAQTITTALISEGSLPLWFSYEVDDLDFCKNFDQDYHAVIYMPEEMKGNTIHWIEDRIIEAHLKYGVTAVYIDHLHFLVSLNSKANMSLVIGDVVRSLKEIAKKHRMLIFLVCHTAKTRSDDGELSLGDVRDSSFIEQEADCVVYCYRDVNDQRITWCKVAKNRKRGIINVKVPLVLKNGVYRETEFFTDDPDNYSRGNSRAKGKERSRYAD